MDVERGEFTNKYFIQRGPEFLLKRDDAILAMPRHVRYPFKYSKFSFSEITDEVEGKLVDLILRCLAVDPRSRITAEEALKHPFLK